MEHNIKLNRAKSIARLLPTAERAIFYRITKSCPRLVDRLSAHDLADMAKALNAHWYEACRQTARDIAGKPCGAL